MNFTTFDKKSEFKMEMGFYQGDSFNNKEVINNTNLLDKEYKKEELIKLSKEGSHTPFAICFYLEAPENIEGPISARVNYI